MTTLLMAPEFLDQNNWQQKVKSPLELVVGAVCAVNAEITIPTALSNPIAAMGQPLYSKLEPTGYPNTREGWFRGRARDPEQREIHPYAGRSPRRVSLGLA